MISDGDDDSNSSSSSSSSTSTETSQSVFNNHRCHATQRRVSKNMPLCVVRTYVVLVHPVKEAIEVR
jgi:hypothetical protein